MLSIETRHTFFNAKQNQRTEKDIVELLVFLTDNIFVQLLNRNVYLERSVFQWALLVLFTLFTFNQSLLQKNDNDGKLAQAFYLIVSTSLTYISFFH